MKRFTFIVTLLISIVLITKSSRAQDYPTAVGLKFGGYEAGFSAKHFINTNTALEGVLGFRSHGFVVTGLYEIHARAFNTSGLNFYYGGGAHLGRVGQGLYRYFGDDHYYNNARLLLGADGVVGLEYKITEIPIAVSLDLNPRVELATGPFFDLAPGLGIKYTF